jgi:AraC-like DNA-binding protein
VPPAWKGHLLSLVIIVLAFVASGLVVLVGTCNPIQLNLAIARIAGLHGHARKAAQHLLPNRALKRNSLRSRGVHFDACCRIGLLPFGVMKLQATPPGQAPSAMHPSIAWAMAYIDEHLDERLSLAELAAKAGLSVWRFSTVFRQHAGVSPRRYICGLRVQRVQSLLAGGESLATAALLAGFYDQSHLCRHFKNTCGMTPGQYANRRRGSDTAVDATRELLAA